MKNSARRGLNTCQRYGDENDPTTGRIKMEQHEITTKTIAAYLASLRQKAGWSRMEMARLVGCSEQHVRLIEQAKRCPSAVYYLLWVSACQEEIYDG